MNTDLKNYEPRARGSRLHPEQAASGSERIGLYQVTLHITEQRLAFILVPAKSAAEARLKAPDHKIEDEWTVERTIDVTHTELVTEFVREEVCHECI